LIPEQGNVLGLQPSKVKTLSVLVARCGVTQSLHWIGYSETFTQESHTTTLLYDPNVIQMSLVTVLALVLLTTTVFNTILQVFSDTVWE
jgi:hypothetical protein